MASSASSSHTSRHSASSPSIKDLDDKEFRERVLFALRHQIRPAEEVDAVRRQMARNLAETLGMSVDDNDGNLNTLASPLALVDADLVPPSPPPPSAQYLSPLQREFVEAVRTNVELRADFAKTREDLAAEQQRQQHRDDENANQDPNEGEGETTEALEAELLQLQLRHASLQQGIDRYDVALQHMERLGKQPAAQPSFLDPQTMFQEAGCDPLPEMPRELMDGFTIDRGASEVRAQAQFQRLKKESVRQNLVAQQQERRADEALAQARERDPSFDPSAVPPEVQVRALGAVKDHLIGWIETHLSIAGGDGDEGDGEDEPSFVAESPEKKQRESPRKAAAEENAADDDDAEGYDYDAQMAEVQREYDRHVELRKEVLTLISYHEKMTREQSHILKEDQREQRQKTENKGKDEDEPVRPPPPTATSTNASLITPYIEKLQAIAREQKGLAQEKSHINSMLARHQQETREMLGHLAEESQLLARFPSAAREKTPVPPSSSVSSADFGEATREAAITAAKDTTSSLATQLEPWLLAADAAKLATLETVAEKVEEGQMAVDDAMAALDEARKLLNKEEEEEDSVDGEQAAGAQNVSMSGAAAEGGKSIYAKLDGNLGLINE